MLNRWLNGKMRVSGRRKTVYKIWSQSWEASVCRFLLQWHVPNACQLGGSDPEKFTTQKTFGSDLHLYEIVSVFIQIQLCEENTFSSLTVAGWLEEGSLQRFTSVLFLCWLALGGSQLAAKVLRCCIQQPVGIHQAQVSHVAAGRVQQLIEDHVRWLGLEKDGGGVDGHRLVCVQG